MVKLDPLGINDGNLHIDKMAYRGSEEQVKFPTSLDLRPLLSVGGLGFFLDTHDGMMVQTTDVDCVSIVHAKCT